MGQKFAALSETAQAIADRFKLAREEAGVTQEKIGRHIGLSRDQVASVESKRVLLRFWPGWRFCSELDINASWLAHGEEPMRPCIDYFKAWMAPPEIDDNPEIDFISGFAQIEYKYDTLFREEGHTRRRVGALRGELRKRVHAGGAAHKEAILALVQTWLDDVGPDNRDALLAHLVSATQQFKSALKKKR